MAKNGENGKNGEDKCMSAYLQFVLHGYTVVVPDAVLRLYTAGPGDVGEGHHHTVGDVRDVRERDRQQGALRDGFSRVLQVTWAIQMS